MMISKLSYVLASCRDCSLVSLQSANCDAFTKIRITEAVSFGCSDLGCTAGLWVRKIQGLSRERLMLRGAT